jgi:16S rRNA (guanine527-N7)-methyltransferase
VLEIVAQEAPRYGVRLSALQIDMLARYAGLLQAWSGRANLVGDASSETVQRRHFLESIALGAALREREVLRPASAVVDVGAGAGFPGLVLKIVWPGIRLALLEATAKKTAFLAAVVDALVLEDVRVITARAEDAAHDPELRGAYDLVVARAVAPLPALLELTLPFAKVGGRVVTPKGARADTEVAAAAEALRVLGGKAFVVPFDVPGPPQRIVAVLKQRDTPPEYPRRAGMPKKRPL